MRARCLWFVHAGRVLAPVLVLSLLAMMFALMSCGGELTAPEPIAPEPTARGVVCIAWPCCGDGVCDGGENCASCPSDCACPIGQTCQGVSPTGTVPVCVPACGDGTCDPSIGEDCMTCTADCACTGMNHCQPGPGGGGVPAVCVSSCGDFVCEPARGETCLTCAIDCPVCTDARIVTGADAGGGAHVRTFSGSGGPAEASFLAYPNFGGGVRVASLPDGDGDGKPDIVVGPGPGIASLVEVYSSAGTLRSSFDAYPGFTGGVYVAAGDVSGDGAAEIVTGPGEGGGPVVRVWRRDGTMITGFYAFEPSFAGGIRVAVADLDGDGKGEIVVGAGPGRAAAVRAFRGDGTPFGGELAPFDPSLRGGVYVGGGDVDGASPRRDEILVGIGDTDRVAKPVLASQPGLKYFGYTWGDSDYLGHYMDEYAAYNNFTGINSTDLVRDARKARRLGLSVMLDVSDCFFEPNCHGCGEGWHLRENWQSTWAACVPRFRPVLDIADLFAFYIMDEPYGHNLTKPEVETAINAVHAAFPGEKTMIVENENDWVVGPPAGIDIYSIDCYLGDPAQHPTRWQQCKDKIRAGGNAAPWAQLLVTVEAFGTPAAPPTPAQQQLWYEFAQQLADADPRYIGMYWFLYSDQVPPELGFQGTRAFPPVKAYHSTIALPHLCANTWETLRVCGTNGVTYQNPDLAKCAGTTIAAYGACGPQVRALRSDGSAVGPGVTPYWPPSWRGVRVAGVDLDRDGRAEIVTGPGEGLPAIVRRFLGDGTPLGLDFNPYPGFTGGVFVGGGTLSH